MTRAVCFKCGEIKFGALNRCENCGTAPRSDDELTISLAFNDNNFDSVMFERIASDIKIGNPPWLSNATRVKLLPGVREAKRMIGIKGARESKPASRREPFFNWPEITWWLRNLFLPQRRRKLPHIDAHKKKLTSEKNDRESKKGDDENSAAQPKTPLAAYCYKVSTPEAFYDFSRTPSKGDARVYVMSILFMSAAGHFIRDFLEKDDVMAVEVRRYLHKAHLDVIAAEAMVWFSFLIDRLWEADQENDPEMHERIGSSTIYLAKRISVDVIAELTGHDFKAQWMQRTRFFASRESSGDLAQSFASVLFLSAERRALDDQLRPASPTDLFRPEWMPLALSVNIFFSTMPQAYYKTFKNMLREWPDRFPHDAP